MSAQDKDIIARLKANDFQVARAAIIVIEELRMEVNKFELIAEDLEACMLAMDRLDVPRSNEYDVVYSVFGRACRMRDDLR